MKVFVPGTEVRINSGEPGDGFVARVIALQIDTGVSYKLAWFDDKDRKEEWIEPFEIEPMEHTEYAVFESENYHKDYHHGWEAQDGDSPD